jgi:hypothetical protein
MAKYANNQCAMNNKAFSLLVLLLAIAMTTFCQNPIVLTVNQPEPLKADAGSDVQINKGESVTLGGIPSASNGYPGYLYFWSPVEGLNDPTLPNPVASPELATTYLLTVTDANNCSSVDEVVVAVNSTGINDLPSGIRIRCYPNPVKEVLLVEWNGISGNVNIRMINNIGMELFTRIETPAGNESTLRIPMQNYPDGVYYIQIITDKATYHQSVIKTL